MPPQRARTDADAHGAVLDKASRAAMYRLLARFMDRPPGRSDLEAAAGLRAEGSELELAIASFAAAAAGTNADEQSIDFHDLFIGLAAGEVVPYASHYDTGTLNDLALVAVRHDLQRLGLRRRNGISEPEDHAASILEAMAALIDRLQQTGDRRDSAEQADAFLERHVLSWMPRLFRDLARKHERPFYMALGALGGAFLQTERARLSERQTHPELAT